MLMLAAAAGALFSWLRLPLPWMIGPLLAVAAGKSAGLALEVPAGAREGGQAVIAVALGLYFTPAVSLEVARYLPWMLAAGAVAFGVGLAGGASLRRLMGQDAAGRPVLDRATAFFASVPGGASEMAVLVERYGGRVDLVAFAQSFRILLVVVSVPFVYTYAGIHGVDVHRGVSVAVSGAGLAGQVAAALAAGFVLARLGAPNPYMLGPLALTIALTASDVVFSAIPGWLSAAAQLCLGAALGVKFERDFLRRAPRFAAAVAAATGGAMLLTSMFAVLLWHLAGIGLPTGVLALAPGGIAEMCITAKVLQLGVPVVTAFHVARVVILVLASGAVYRILLHRRADGVGATNRE
ncbi:MAG: AbrB family transcriptional regulator [Burkholderiales bacterium]|nr:AbrB family transcriptional regulator [Burkholderiales bacterium]